MPFESTLLHEIDLEPRVGQNPTAGTLSVQRRKDIYEVCVKFDVVIIEDDPYWYLQYPSANQSSRVETITSDDSPPRKSSGYPFLDSLVPSYLSVDYQGRVVRLDTFSKTVAPGCRMGWITTQPALCERLLRITETSTQRMYCAEPISLLKPALKLWDMFREHLRLLISCHFEERSPLIV